MLDFDFMHVIESSIGLTIGSLLARAIGNACSRTCSKPDVQQIEKQEDDDEHDLSDNNSDISIYNYCDSEQSNQHQIQQSSEHNNH